MQSESRGTARILVGLTALAAIAGVYILVRPTLRGAYLSLLEYPIAVALVAFIVWRAARRPRRAPVPAAQAPASTLRRHEQIVRTLPDPDAVAIERTLTRWIETGADAMRVADVLARASRRMPRTTDGAAFVAAPTDRPSASGDPSSASAPDPTRRDAERARILPLLAEADSRKARARLLRTFLSGVQGD